MEFTSQLRLLVSFHQTCFTIWRYGYDIVYAELRIDYSSQESGTLRHLSFLKGSYGDILKKKYFQTVQDLNI